MTKVIPDLFKEHNEEAFGKIALEIFKLQFEGNNIYREYCGLMKISKDEVDHFLKIPFLPISFFKHHKVITSGAGEEPIEAVFSSSGTTGQETSKHYVRDLSVYEKSFTACFERFYGKPEDYCLLALLPSYLERGGSSLVYMADKLISRSRMNGSGFYLHNLDELRAKISDLKLRKQKTILLGVTYALLDLSELNVRLDENFIVMETGGMKGKRPEMVKEELHQILGERFGVDKIHSEYGMTELLSQAYSRGDGIFEPPPWMKIVVRDPYDPLQIFPPERSGAINIIDLANIHSCAFIATEDLGRNFPDGRFEVLGRMNDAELRGCNLMIV